MTNNPKIITDKFFKIIIIEDMMWQISHQLYDICEVNNDSLIIMQLFIIIKNWTQKLRDHYFKNILYII